MAKIKRPAGNVILKRCNDLWSVLVKIRSGYRSEVSWVDAYHKDINPDGKQIESHHILGRTGHALKFNLDNGIALTVHEHKFHRTKAAHAVDPTLWWMWFKKHHGPLLGMLEDIRDTPGPKESATAIYWRLRDEYDEMIESGKAREPYIAKLKGMER